MKTELRDFAEVVELRKERDRYKQERNELLLKLAEIMDEESKDDGEELDSGGDF